MKNFFLVKTLFITRRYEILSFHTKNLKNKRNTDEHLKKNNKIKCKIYD